ncbi:MAG: glucuronate isomerase [Christensenellales bacterium]
MKGFLDDDFLLNGETARTLYFDYARNLPIIDYHCHLPVRALAENQRFDNITKLWLDGDHYKWRLMRNNGVDEYYIGGKASDREKFDRFVATLQRAIGNPLYHWCHLELKRYFGIDEPLTLKNAGDVWERVRRLLQQDDMGAKGLVEMSGVEFIGTTDDPADDLRWHRQLAEDKSFGVKVCPSFRPDRALNIDKPQWKEYIGELSSVCGRHIADYDDLKYALSDRMKYFDYMGCRASDHGTEYLPACNNKLNPDKIFDKVMSGQTITTDESDAFKYDLLRFCAGQYADMGWVMQLHFNCKRNPNSKAYGQFGADSGFDCIGYGGNGKNLTALLDDLFASGSLPKTILYSLDPGDNAFLDVLAGSFQGSEAAGKIQHGSAWWFNDNKQGIEQHLTSLASLGVLGNFVGMLTDSRSFLSFARHEYFRRILCDLIGEWTDKGEYPCDIGYLGGLVEDVCYHNAKKYFGLGE